MKIDTDAIAREAFQHMDSENDLNWSVAAALYELHPEWMNVVSEKMSAMWTEKFATDETRAYGPRGEMK